ncbi:MAG: CHAD domain-containing protein [Acidimicrobiales bacterium]|jgi:triphosphatase
MGAANVSRTDVEVEWQLDALDLRPVERFLNSRFADASRDDDAASGVPGGGGSAVVPPGLKVVPRPAKRLVDTYLDTEDWRIARSGYVLRTRRRGGVVEATMKDLTPAADGLRHRMEATESLPGEGVDGLDPEGSVGRRVQALSGDRPLHQVLEVRTRRRLYSLVVNEEPIGEVALDDTTILLSGDPQRLRLQRVEIEVLASWVDSLQPFVEQLRRDCGLQPATLSKFEAGLMAAGIALPDRIEAGSVAVGADATLGELAYAVIRRDAAGMLRHEPGTRLGEDPEALHQMRVATRRLRAALALFVPALPVRADRLSAELGWLADVLGAVRDLDVQLGNLDEWCEDLPGEHGQALDDLGDLMARHRDEARARLLDALESRRYERLVAGLHAMLEQGPLKRSPQANALAVSALPELIGQRHRAAVRAAKRAQSSRVLTDFHRLRIRCKRLRYALEFTSGLYGNEVKRFAKKVAGLQVDLGLIQDAEVAYERLRGIAVSSEGAGLSQSTIFAMGMAAQRCREDAAHRLRALSTPVDALRGAEWRRAADALDDAKAVAEAKALHAAASTAAAKQAARVRRTPVSAPSVAPATGRARSRPRRVPALGAGASRSGQTRSVNGVRAPGRSPSTTKSSGGASPPAALESAAQSTA